MPGDERMRFCKSCSKSVFNISDLTREEAEVLFLKKRGDLCVKLFRRFDGTVMFEDCPAAIRKVRNFVRLVAALVTGFLSSFLACPVRAQGLNTRDPAPPVVTGMVELGGAFLGSIDVDEQDSIEAKKSSKNRRVLRKNMKDTREHRKRARRNDVLGTLSERQGRIDEAISHFRKAIQEQPYETFSLHACARLLEKRDKEGDREEAMKLREEIAEMEKHHRLDKKGNAESKSVSKKPGGSKRSSKENRRPGG